MFKLIDKIKPESKIEIGGASYSAVAKTFYVTETNTEQWCCKVILSNHKILVFMPYENLITFGEVVADFCKGEEFPENCKYNGLEFKKVDEGYQIVTKIEFGDPLISEGEVYWADYASDQDESIDINMAYVHRTKKRADIAAKFISEDQIKIKTMEKNLCLKHYLPQ